MGNKIKVKLRAMRLLAARVLTVVIFFMFFLPSMMEASLVPGGIAGVVPGMIPGPRTVLAAAGENGEEKASGSQISGGGHVGTATGSQAEGGYIEDEDEILETGDMELGTGTRMTEKPKLAVATESDAWLDYRDESWTGGEIRTAEELAQFAWLVEEGEYFDGETVSLAADINLEEYLWKPIDDEFQGTFDGKNHSIKGLRAELRDPVFNWGGFFSSLNGAEVKNLHISGKIEYDSDSMFLLIGGLAGSCEKTNVVNCSTDMTVQQIEGTPPAVPFLMSYIGSMLGYVENSSVENCESAGKVFGTIEDETGSNPCAIFGAGGMAGGALRSDFINCRNTADVKLVNKTYGVDEDEIIYGICAAGGITGTALSPCTIDRCTNEGSIYAGGYSSFSGGIGGTLYHNIITNCVNRGVVRAEGKHDAGAGGISGSNIKRYAFVPDGYVANCANHGQVKSSSPGSAWTGGILGNAGNNEGDIPFQIENCVSTGKLTAEGDGGGEPEYRALAGICAYGKRCEIRRCFWLNGTAGEAVILDGGVPVEEETVVYDSQTFRRVGGRYVFGEEVSGTFYLLDALNRWAAEKNMENPDEAGGVSFDGWKLIKGKPVPDSGVNPSDHLDSEEMAAKNRDSDRDDKSSWSGNTGSDSKWIQDERGWRCQVAQMKLAADGWFLLGWNGISCWYHFDKDGYMDTGWFTDTDGTVYYLHPLHDGKQGYMYTGWNTIDGKQYYFEEEAGKGQGALYRSRMTPDGRMVDENGGLIE